MDWEQRAGTTSDRAFGSIQSLGEKKNTQKDAQVTTMMWGDRTVQKRLKNLSYKGSRCSLLLGPRWIKGTMSKMKRRRRGRETTDEKKEEEEGRNGGK